LAPDRYAEPVIIARQSRIGLALFRPRQWMVQGDAGGMHPLDVGSAVYL
jgi:hypothetical protein